MTPISCENARLLVSDLLARSAEAEESRALDAHLRECALCREFARALAEQDLDLRENVVRSSLEAGNRLQEALGFGSESAAPAPTDPVRKATRRSRRHVFVQGAGGISWGLALAAAAVFVGVVALLALSPGGTDPDLESARLRAVRSEQRQKAARAREEAIRRAEEEQARTRGERERLEKELVAKEDAARRMAAEKSLARDEKLREELKAREAELEKTAADFRERLRLAQEKERQATEAMAKAALPPADPPAEATPVKPGTRTGIARIERATAAQLVHGERRTELKGGEEAIPGQGLEVGPGGVAILVFPDETRLELGAGTEVGDLRTDGGKRLFMAKGEIRARIARQPAGQPMIFLTPIGEAKALGTTLRLLVDPDPKKGVRLDVEEGKVQLKSKLTGKTVDVVTGHYAVAAAGAEMIARSRPIEDVVLLPRQAKITGDEWRVAKDPQAPGGVALESAIQMWRSFPSKDNPDFLRKYQSFVTFTFTADADKDYHVWIRGRYIPVFRKEMGHGSVAVEAPTGRFTGQCPWFSQISESGFMFDHFSSRTGYWWAGGNEQEKRIGTALRFAKGGTQVLRLYGTEPLLIDGIWLSTAQSSRPADNAQVPMSEK